MAMDANGRSTLTERSIELVQVSETECVSEKQDAAAWTIAVRAPEEPFAGGPHEMHLTNRAVIVWFMQGHAEITLQDGETSRLGTGDGIFIDGRALHHTTFARSRTPVVMLNVTSDSTEGFELRQAESEDS
jgi:uncharacterized cupin superfamily protein